ncbi:hypothetical protein F5148DRAFT_4796 [Russula earlei]|uniref:Uncharacterized protein n=1 Tax=Russula earlei TaxID=71964 RepID=A0ACC0UNZ8_9AGAM|nr:hypothetical protein F5148DRAFT_4796 [Russula earlei]
MEKPKKRKVSAALHSEISEYASLIRVLRTSDMLDITAQLTRPDSPPTQRRVTDNEEETNLRETPDDIDRGGVSGLSIEDMDHRSALHPSIPPQTSHKTWTRWPLLTEDLHIPEWGFEDEVHSLAKQALLSHLSTSSQLPPDSSSQSRDVDCDSLSEDQIEALLPPSSSRALVDVSSSHLERILSALASYSPPVDKSALHRRRPINWGNVLNIVSAAGLVDGNVIRNVKSRLETIYGSHPDVNEVTSNASEIPALPTLHDLDSANFFDGGRPAKRKFYGRPKKMGD